MFNPGCYFFQDAQDVLAELSALLSIDDDGRIMGQPQEEDFAKTEQLLS